MPRKKRSLSPFELMDDDFDDTSSQSSRNGNPPIQRNAANARERARMRVLSSAFGRLKTKLPNIPADTKLSKLDTLRLATMYIKQLKSVVEGEAVSAITNGENMEGSSNNNLTNCYLNLNMGVQNMNWPFGFHNHHHHFSNSSLTRSTSSTALMNNNSNSNNWCPGDNSNEEQIKQAFYESEHYKHHYHHQQQSSSSSFINHNTLSQQNNHYQHDHWYSETPSPELESTSNICLSFENSHFQHRSEHHRQQQSPQQLHNNSRHHNHNLSHLQPASLHSSTTFQLQHDFQRESQHHQPSASLHLHQNGFVNSSSFQSTSIR